MQPLAPDHTSQMCRRYVWEREHILPQLQWEEERQRVPPPILEDRLLTALAASTWAAAALQLWQCHGGSRPLWLPHAHHDCSASSQAWLLRRRHHKLADMHRALLKVGGRQERGARSHVRQQ